jgi:hypothetical protein
MTLVKSNLGQSNNCIRSYKMEGHQWVKQVKNETSLQKFIEEHFKIEQNNLK